MKNNIAMFTAALDVRKRQLEDHEIAFLKSVYWFYI